MIAAPGYRVPRQNPLQNSPTLKLHMDGGFILWVVHFMALSSYEDPEVLVPSPSNGVQVRMADNTYGRHGVRQTGRTMSSGRICHAEGKMP